MISRLVHLMRESILILRKLLLAADLGISREGSAINKAQFCCSCCYWYPSYSLLTRDVTSVLSVQMVVKGKWQCKLLLQNIYMYTIATLEVVYDHVGKCRKFALCCFTQINLILFCLTTIWKWNFKQKVTWLKPKNYFVYGVPSGYTREHFTACQQDLFSRNRLVQQVCEQVLTLLLFHQAQATSLLSSTW